MVRRLLFALYLSSGFASLAIAAPEAAPAPVGAGSVLQVLLGLAVVLGMVFAAAWAMRRFNPHATGGSNAIRIVSGTAVGNRERVVLLEVADTWLVVGVAPGHVTPLHSMPRPANVQTAQAPSTPAGFSAWLKKAIEKKNPERRNG